MKKAKKGVKRLTAAQKKKLKGGEYGDPKRPTEFGDPRSPLADPRPGYADPRPKS